jgi:hypothetical protein
VDDADLMLFQKRFWEPIQTGSVTLTFRRWKRAQVVVDRTYRSTAGRLHVTGVDIVEASDITEADAVRAGHPDAASLIADLRGSEGAPIYRIVFEFLEEPDPRDLLAEDHDLSGDDVAEITQRLSRMDRASNHGPWTLAYLEAIAEHPGRRAPDNAASFGRETQSFKTDVRKLKNLGLTLSLRIGYELSPRGAAYLDARRSS